MVIEVSNFLVRLARETLLQIYEHISPKYLAIKAQMD